MSDSATQPPDTNMELNEELDPAVEEEINHDATQVDNMNLDGPADGEPAVNGVANVPSTEARIPAKKDATLREFLGKMDEYAPIVCLSIVYRIPKDTADMSPDSRCSHKLLSHTRRPASATSYITSSCPPPRACDAEIHRRYCRGCLPVLPHPIVQYH
jgi:hypothetical protein